jgi:hypothetical protein
VEEFLPDLKPEPLNRGVVDGNISIKRWEPVSSRERACECGYTHAGRCWRTDSGGRPDEQLPRRPAKSCGEFVDSQPCALADDSISLA